ncbi:HEPN domain-containing protein [Candidatus Auribacterota bacterium]
MGQPVMTFNECLKRGRIREFSQGKDLVQKELETARRDLADGKEGFEREKYKWATIQSYYSMFHSARALLYHKNYREKSHYCLIIAMKHIYVKEGILSVYFVEALQKGKDLREDADYYDDWSKITSDEMLKMAGDFLKRAEDIISNK